MMIDILLLDGFVFLNPTPLTLHWSVQVHYPCHLDRVWWNCMIIVRYLPTCFVWLGLPFFARADQRKQCLGVLFVRVCCLFAGRSLRFADFVACEAFEFAKLHTNNGLDTNPLPNPQGSRI